MKNYLTILFIAFTLVATAQSDTIRTNVPGSESPIVTDTIRTRIPCGNCPMIKIGHATYKKRDEAEYERLLLLQREALRKGAATPQKN